MTFTIIRAAKGGRSTLIMPMMDSTGRLTFERSFSSAAKPRDVISSEKLSTRVSLSVGFEPDVTSTVRLETKFGLARNVKMVASRPVIRAVATM